MHVQRLHSFALFSLLSLIQANYHQARWAVYDDDLAPNVAIRDADPEANAYDTYNFGFDLLERDAEADPYYYDDDDILPRHLAARGNKHSKPEATKPSKCDDVWVDNPPNHVPARSRIDCYNRVKCEGSKKKYVGLSPLLEKDKCLKACRCP